LVYKTAGAQSAATPVVLIHGFGGDSDNWLFNIEEIGKDRPVYALDLPGHGKSTKTLASGDLGELADAVLDLLQEVDAAKAHLVGHSLGAAVAFQVLADRPERVASIVGLAPAGLDDRIRPDYVDGLVAAEKRKDVKAALQLLFADPGLVSAQMVEGIQRFKRLEGAASALRAIGERNLPSGRQVANFRDLVGEERVATLIIWGDRDAILDPAAATGLPSSVEVIRIQDIGHMPHMEAARTVNRHLTRHFDTVDPRNPSVE
jgi:pyruvate dehydrogenase E2 component (dihydrolipoamide acetyltransferase)